MDSLPFNVQCPKEEIELVKYLYENKLKKVSMFNSIYLKLTSTYDYI